MIFSHGQKLLFIRCGLLQRSITRYKVSSSVSNENDLVLSSTKNHVTTITLNNPAKYNSWGRSLTDQMIQKFEEAASDPSTKVEINCMCIVKFQKNKFYANRGCPENENNKTNINI